MLISICVLSCQQCRRAQVTGDAPAIKRLEKQRSSFYLEEWDSDWGIPSTEECLGVWETYIPLSLIKD